MNFNNFLNIVQQLFLTKLSFKDIVLDITEKDIEDMILLTQNHRMHNIMYQLLYEKFPANKLVIDTYNDFQVYVNNTVKDFKQVIKILDEGKYKYCIIKGIPLSMQIYDDPTIRSSSDIDIIIDKADLNRLFAKMREYGYRQQWNEDADEPIIYYNYLYHEVRLIKNNVYLNPKVELKWGSSALKKQGIEWFNDEEVMNIYGCNVKTQRQNYALIHLFANVFMDNDDINVIRGNHLRNYFDIAYYLEYKYKGDFGSIIELTKGLDCNRKLYNVLCSLHQLFDFKAFDIDKAIKLSKDEAILYPNIVPFISASDDFMGGSRISSNIIRMSAPIRLMNNDFAYYEYVKNYKLAVFSKLSLYYLNRKILLKNQSSEWDEYVDNKSVSYRYCNDDDYIKMECKIPKVEYDKLKDNYGVKIIIFNNNPFMAYLHNDYYIRLNTNEFEHEIIKQQEYKEYSDAFMIKYKDLFIEPVVYGSMTYNEDCYVYTFELYKNTILIEHNTLLVEFRFCEIHENGFHTNKGFKQEIIELL